jgi:hypothetical protein
MDRGTRIFELGLAYIVSKGMPKRYILAGLIISLYVMGFNIYQWQQYTLETVDYLELTPKHEVRWDFGYALEVLTGEKSRQNPGKVEGVWYPSYCGYG